MGETVKTYENESIKIFWRPDICAHSGICVKGLSNVFDVKKRPWISPQNAASDEIMCVIDRCPSKALSYQTKLQEK